MKPTLKIKSGSALLWLLSFGVLFGSSSCFNILEIIELKKDGSGEYKMEVDMGEMMNMMNMFSGMADSTAISENKEVVSLDSLISFSSMEDSIKRKWQYPDVTSKGMMRMVMDTENSMMTVTFSLAFNDIVEVNKFNVDMNTGFSAFDSPLNPGEDGGTDMIFMGGGLDHFAFKGGQFSRSNMASEEMEEENQEEADMMKMMLADAKYSVRYIMPGKVKKVEGLDYTIEEDHSTVTRTFNFAELIEQKVDFGVVINYK